MIRIGLKLGTVLAAVTRARQRAPNDRAGAILGDSLLRPLSVANCLTQSTNHARLNDRYLALTGP